MEEAVELGLTKFIGVSNFDNQQVQNILDNSKIKPVNNQVSNRTPSLNFTFFYLFLN